MVRTAVLIAALAVAGSAHAQTVVCRDTYYGMPQLGQTCEKQFGLDDLQRSAAPSGPAPTYRWQDVAPKPCSTFERINEGAGFCSARQIASNRKAVGEMIGQGKCAEALKAALATGDLDFAREVRGFCAAPANDPLGIRPE